ncbi:UNVERIFIED_ORG: hypothetical protein J2W74_002052 [Methylorubrum zatmanii]
MTGFDPVQSHRGTSPAARGSPSRRRLLAILSSLPMIGSQSLEAEPHRRNAGTSTLIDPMLWLFAEFRALLDRHEAALAACDRVEAQILAHVGLPTRATV